MSRNNYFSKEEILSLTSGGRDVFIHELGYIPSRNISSPLRTGDAIPSFKVKESASGIWYATDFNGSFHGNAIDFVAALYSISFTKAIEKITHDLNLSKNIISNVTYEKIVKKEKQKANRLLEIEFTDMKFTTKHHEYFNKGHLTEDFLFKHDIFAVEKWAIEKKVYKPKDDEIVFAYYARDINKSKILRIGPNVKKEDKWRSGMNNTYLWSYWEYINDKVNDLLVIKSRKDEMIARLLGYNTISTQNESANIMLTSGNVEKINSISNNPIMCYGTDKQGKEQSILITQETGWKWFNIKNTTYEKYNTDDLFAFASEFGLTMLDNLIKLKKIEKRNDPL